MLGEEEKHDSCNEESNDWAQEQECPFETSERFSFLLNQLEEHEAYEQKSDSCEDSQPE